MYISVYTRVIVQSYTRRRNAQPATACAITATQRAKEDRDLRLLISNDNPAISPRVGGNYEDYNRLTRGAEAVRVPRTRETVPRVPFVRVNAARGTGTVTPDEVTLLIG